MSEQTTFEIARKYFDALDRGDIATALSCLADDVEWINLPSIKGVSDIIPWLGTCHGVAEVAESFRIRNEVVEIKLFKPRDLVVQGDQAVGTIQDRAMVKSSGQEFDITFASWMRIANGRIVHWKSYCDPSPIIAAFRVGLEAQLLKAVAEADPAAVKSLLERGASANARDAMNGLTVLMMAACQASSEIVKLLLEAGADVFTTERKTGATALHKACQGGSLEVGRLLVEAGAFVDAVTPTMGHTPVMDALWYKWPALVRYLVDQDADLNLSTHYGFSMWDHLKFELNVNALGKDKLEEIDRIFKARVASDKETIARQTVMAATEKNDGERVHQLIQAGADVNAVYPHVNSFLDGHTPLLVAARDGHLKIVKQLLDAGAQIIVEDWVFKGAPIHKATYNGNPEILRLLMDRPGIDLDVQGPINGYTPLHDALWHGYDECARILIEAGARLDLRGHDGKTPLDIAVEVYGPEAEIPKSIRAKM